MPIPLRWVARKFPWWIAVLAAASVAHAGTASVDVERFAPQMDGRGLFTLESAETHHAGQWGVGLLFNYSRRPLLLHDADGHVLDLVAHRLTADLVASLGVARWLTLEAALPVALLNEAAPNLRGVTTLSGLGSARFGAKVMLLPQGRFGVGLALHAVATLPTGNPNAFLSQNGVVFSPSLLLERQFEMVRLSARLGYTARPPARFRDLVVDDELEFGLGVGLLLHNRVEVGAELVGATAAASPFSAQSALNPLEGFFGARVFLSDRWQFQVGAGRGLSQGAGTPRYRFFTGFVFSPHRLDTDGDGIPDRLDECRFDRGEARNAGCRWPDSDGDGVHDEEDDCPTVPGPRENRGCPYTDRDGDGVLDKDDRCPATPGPKENAGCPWPDTDGDGVLDKDDRCPTIAGPKENGGCPWPDSDGDGVLDKDDRCPTIAGPKENGGCPWPDSDGDGVLDKDDRCPSVAGPKENGGCPWPDRDGDGIPDKDDACPDAPGPKERRGCPQVVVTATEVRIDGRIFFSTSKADILPESFAILDDVARVLIATPRVKLLEIQGHTDDVGAKGANRKLSQRRAESVVAYLVKHGVAAARLSAKGYGQDAPLVPIDKQRMSKKALAEARGQNRRVQFVLRNTVP